MTTEQIKTAWRAQVWNQFGLELGLIAWVALLFLAAYCCITALTAS